MVTQNYVIMMTHHVVSKTNKLSFYTIASYHTKFTLLSHNPHYASKKKPSLKTRDIVHSLVYAVVTTSTG